MSNHIIKERRIALKMTMKELAELVGVSEGTISRWESGNITAMKQTKIAALAKALQISPALLISSENINCAITLSAREEIHIKKYRQLDASDQKEVDNFVDFKLTNSEKRNESQLLSEAR